MFSFAYTRVVVGHSTCESHLQVFFCALVSKRWPLDPETDTTRLGKWCCTISRERGKARNHLRRAALYQPVEKFPKLVLSSLRRMAENRRVSILGPKQLCEFFHSLQTVWPTLRAARLCWSVLASSFPAPKCVRCMLAGSTSPPGEGLEKLVDADLRTKWLHFVDKQPSDHRDEKRLAANNSWLVRVLPFRV